MTNSNSAASPFSREDRLLLQMLGGRLRRIMQGHEFETIDSDRLDELGILANLVNRVAKELRNSRREEMRRRHELEQRLAELRTAYETQQQLTSTIKQLSTPILNIHRGLLLLPLIGALDRERAAHVITTLLSKITEAQAHVVILDITGVPAIDSDVATVLLQAARAAALLGSRVILCGISPEVAQVAVSLGLDLAALTPCTDLQVALQRGLALVGQRIGDG